MKIKIIGAAGGEVTGSAYLVRTRRASVLVDCGLFQGGRKSETLNRPPTTPKQKLDAVLLTHGEDGPRHALAGRILQQHQLICTLPAMGDIIET